MPEIGLIDLETLISQILPHYNIRIDWYSEIFHDQQCADSAGLGVSGCRVSDVSIYYI